MCVRVYVCVRACVCHVFLVPLPVSGCVRLFTAGTNPALIWAYCAADLTTALAFHGDNHQ
jgi:hypothetical protein